MRPFKMLALNVQRSLPKKVEESIKRVAYMDEIFSNERKATNNLGLLILNMHQCVL